MHLSESILFQRIFHTPSKFMRILFFEYEKNSRGDDDTTYSKENNNPSRIGQNTRVKIDQFAACVRQ